MDKFDRILLLHRLFTQRRRGASLTQLANELECSSKTVTRTIELMRNQLNAPIEYVKAEHGYRYVSTNSAMFDLPGLWLSASELQSMVLLLGMLENLGNSVLGNELKAVRNLIAKNLSARGVSQPDLSRRIKVLSLAHKAVSAPTFSSIGEALLARKQLELEYVDYGGKRSRRILSPQTLVYYRDNWYLDAWCHKREALRVFSLARIGRCEIADTDARELATELLTQHFAGGYGIFAGQPKARAELRFTPPIAMEVARQQWHPLQQGEWQNDDYHLDFPYSDERELLGDIFRHLPHVEVIKPASLKKAVKARLNQSLGLYK